MTVFELSSLNPMIAGRQRFSMDFFGRSARLKSLSAAAVAGVATSLLLAGGAHAAGSPFVSADQLKVQSGNNKKILATADGRTVLLRGANINSLVSYDNGRTVAPTVAKDVEQMKALGFNVARIAVSWSSLQPTSSGYDEAYVAQIKSLASLFTNRGIYVVLDMHQDRFAKGLNQGNSSTEVNGAPAWAAVTSGVSCSGGSGHPYYASPCARKAAENFFVNNVSVDGKTLQDHYAAALVKLNSVGKELGPGYAGIDLYNEPISPDPAQPDSFEPNYIYPLYQRAINALRGNGYTGPIWIEPDAKRTATDRNTAVKPAFTDTNLVYAPHIYTDIYSVGGVSKDTGPRLTASIGSAEAEAATLGAALVPGEFPGVTGGNFEEYRRYELNEIDSRGVGGIWWVWKQTAAFSYGWGILNEDGSPRDGTSIAQDLGRVRVVSAPGLKSSSYNPGGWFGWGKGFTVKTSGPGKVTIWNGVDGGSTGVLRGSITVDGQTVTPTTATHTSTFGTIAAGGRELTVTVGSGDHTVFLGG